MPKIGDLDELLQSQHGLVTRRQTVDLVGAWALRRAVTDGQLIKLGGGVFRSLGTAATFRQRALAACLAVGPLVAVSHRSAAVLWGYESIAPDPQIDVSIPPKRSGRQHGVRAHRVALDERDIDRRHGIPVTGPGRTLVDLAGVVAPAMLERCVDDALRGRHTTADELVQWLEQMDRRPRGVARLRRLLELRRSSGVGDSAGVDRVHRWIARAGLAPPVLGLAVVIGGRPRLIDLAYPGEQIAIEFNGWEYHQMRSRMDADHVRTTELELAGWLVIVVTSAHTESETVDRISRALALRGRAGVVPSRPEL